MQIENVYEANLTRAFERISQIVKRYRNIGFDTEFPGFFTDINELSVKLKTNLPAPKTSFDIFRQNINNLKLIQLGIAFCDDFGATPSPAAYSFWFKFDIENDICSEESRQFIRKSFQKPGELERFKTEGIELTNFSHEFLTSGLAYNPALKWFCFQGNQDVGYLVRALIFEEIITLKELKRIVKEIFPILYDLKVITGWDFSLSNLASSAAITREGTEHHAGSDALLTLRLCMKEKDHWMHEGQIYGFDTE